MSIRSHHLPCSLNLLKFITLTWLCDQPEVLHRKSLHQLTGEHKSALHVSQTTIKTAHFKTGHFKTGQGLFQNKPTQRAALGQYLSCLKYFDVNELLQQNTDIYRIGFDIEKKNELQGISGTLTEIAFDRRSWDTSKLTGNCTSLYLAASAQLCTEILQDGEKDFRQLFDS